MDFFILWQKIEVTGMHNEIKKKLPHVEYCVLKGTLVEDRVDYDIDGTLSLHLNLDVPSSLVKSSS